VESAVPGELLAQDPFQVGSSKRVGKGYLHTGVDTGGSCAFGFLYTGKLPECAVALRLNLVLPFSQERGLKVGAVLTDNRRECCGTDTHPDELSLALNGLKHKRTKVRHPQTSGLVERFQRPAKEEFFTSALRETFYESVEALQSAFDRWLVHYNTERPHQGYRNLGKRPIDTINAYLATVKKEA